MACGYLRIITEYPEYAPHLAARIVAWAGRDSDRIDTNTNGRNISVIVPEEIMAGKGALQLIDGGPDVLAVAFMAGRTKVMSVGPGDVAKPTTAGAPSIRIVSLGATAAVTGIAGHPVDIYWGDGTVTKNVASGAGAKRTYAAVGNGRTYLIRVVDTVTKLAAEAFMTPTRICLVEAPAPPPPPPAPPRVDSFNPGCHWAYDNFQMTITGSGFITWNATGFSLVSGPDVLAASAFVRLSDTQLRGNFGEIEFDDYTPGARWLFDVIVTTSTGQLKAPAQFILQPAGQVC